MRKPSLKLICLLAGTLFAGHALAHGIWVEQRRGNLEVVYGEGAADDAYPNSKFHGAWGYDKSGKPLAIRAQNLDTHVRLLPQGSAAVITAALNNGYYTRGADGKVVAKRKSEVSGAKLGAGNWKYNLTVLQGDAKVPTSLDGVRLVVLPETDPTKLSAGGTLPVRVLLDGKPLAGAKIAADHKGMPEDNAIVTDKDGRAAVPVRNNGLNVIAVDYTHKVGLTDPETDEVWMNSTLTFVGTEP